MYTKKVVTRNLKKVYRLLNLDLIFSITIQMLQLPLILYTIRPSKTYIVVAEGGFGHGVTEPHIAQFLFNGDADVFILTDLYRHNPELAKNWNGIKVTLFFKSIFPQTPAKHKFIYEIAKYLVCTVLRVKRSNFYLYEDDYIVYQKSKLYGKGLYALLCREAEKYSDFKGSLTGDIQLNNLEAERYRGNCAYHYLRDKWWTENRGRKIINHVNDPPLRGPINEYRNIVTLYLRYKGNDNRAGGDAATWLPVIKLLTNMQYQVLLVGDRDKSFFQNSIISMSGIYDYSDYSCSKDFYNLWAITKCDFFLGECGGGAWLAPLIGKPSAIVNCFQFAWIGLFNSILVYKTIVTSQGKPLTDAEALRDHFYRVSLPKDYYLENNSSELIISALKEVLECPIDYNTAGNGAWRNRGRQNYFPVGSVPYYSGVRLFIAQ
jgi:putative glycosyltransferase (TIGR04372 family)